MSCDSGGIGIIPLVFYHHDVMSSFKVDNKQRAYKLLSYFCLTASAVKAEFLMTDF